MPETLRGELGQIANSQGLAIRTPALAKKRKEIFLQQLSETGMVLESAKAAGWTNCSYPRQLYHSDPEFKKGWNDAIEAAGYVLEQVAMQRAIKGVKEAVRYKGKIVGYRWKPSDRILELLIKGAMPEKYNQTKAVVEGHINHTHGVALLPTTNDSIENWQKKAIEVHATEPEPVKVIEYQSEEDNVLDELLEFVKNY